MQISNLIKKRKLIQTQAAALLDISQGDVSKLKGGHLQHFSISGLISFIDLLGQEVKVTFKPKATPKTKVKRKVTAKRRKTKATEAA